MWPIIIDWTPVCFGEAELWAKNKFKMVVKKQKAFCKVKIVVDANIVFSGILNTNSKIADILMNSFSFFDFLFIG